MNANEFTRKKNTKIVFLWEQCTIVKSTWRKLWQISWTSPHLKRWEARWVLQDYDVCSLFLTQLLSNRVWPSPTWEVSVGILFESEKQGLEAWTDKKRLGILYFLLHSPISERDNVQTHTRKKKIQKTGTWFFSKSFCQ